MTTVCQNCTFVNQDLVEVCQVCFVKLDKRSMEEIMMDSYKEEKMKLIIANRLKADEIIPESYISIPLLKIGVMINNVKVIALVDTGAMITMTSESIANKCGISNLIDTEYQTVISGAGGSEKTIGTVNFIDMMVGEFSLPTTLRIAKERISDMIIGLDVMTKYRAMVDLGNRCLIIQDKKIPFLKDV